MMLSKESLDYLKEFVFEFTIGAELENCLAGIKDNDFMILTESIADAYIKGCGEFDDYEQLSRECAEAIGKYVYVSYGNPPYESTIARIITCRASSFNFFESLEMGATDAPTYCAVMLSLLKKNSYGPEKISEYAMEYQNIPTSQAV